MAVLHQASVRSVGVSSEGNRCDVLQLDNGAMRRHTLEVFEFRSLGNPPNVSQTWAAAQICGNVIASAIA